MQEMSAQVKEEMSDSSAFTTKLAATMKTNGVTSIDASAIKADTSKEPANAGSSGEEVDELMFDGDDTLSAADDQHGWRLTSIAIFSISVVLHAFM